MTPKLVYVAGTGRSGSTLLELLLATAPGVETVGEVHVLPHELGGGARTLGCACGRSVPECPRWQRVLEQLEPGAVSELARFREHHHAGRTLRPMHVAGRNTPGRREAIDRYATATAQVLAAFAATSTDPAGTPHTLVDASKDPYRLEWLARAGTLDLHVVHLTREPGAFAHSVLRRSHPDAGRIERLGVVGRKALAWDATTVLTLRARRLVGTRRWCELTYEDLAADPRAALAALGARLGIAVPGDAAERYRTLVTHAIAGNPMRRARRPIAPDVTWRSGLTVFERGLVRGLTWPARRVLDRAGRPDAS